MSEITKTLNGQSFNGKVVSLGNNTNSVLVLVTRDVKSKLYNKKVKKSSRIMAHDANGTCLLGDHVTITQCKPYSKNKKFIVVNKK